MLALWGGKKCEGKWDAPSENRETALIDRSGRDCKGMWIQKKDYVLIQVKIARKLSLYF